MTTTVPKYSPDLLGTGVATPEEQKQLDINKAIMAQSRDTTDALFAQHETQLVSQTSTWQRVTDGFGDTAVASAYDYLKDEGLSGAAANTATWLGDLVGYHVGKPNYDKAAMAGTLTQGVPVDMWNDILAHDDLAGAQRARGRIMADLQRQQRMGLQMGGASKVAMMAGSFADLDLPLMAATDGMWGSVKLARAGYKAARIVGLPTKLAGRVASVVDGAALGAESMAVVGGVKAMTDDSFTANQFVDGMIYGGIFGGAFGGLVKTHNATKVQNDVLLAMQQHNRENAVVRPMGEVDTNLSGRQAEGAFQRGINTEVGPAGDANAAASDTGNSVNMISKNTTATKFSTSDAFDQQTEMQSTIVPINAMDRKTLMDPAINPAAANNTHLTAMDLWHITGRLESASFDVIDRLGINHVRAHLIDLYGRLHDLGFGDIIRPIQSKIDAQADVERLFAGAHPDELAAAKEVISSLSGNKAPTIGEIGRNGGVYTGSSLDAADLAAHNNGKAPKANSVSIGGALLSPRVSTFFHEVAHWAYLNILTPNERLEFWKIVGKDFLRDSKKNNSAVDKHLPDRGLVTNSGKSPQELFANQFDVWMTRRMGGKYKALASDTLWQKVVGKMQNMLDWYNATPVHPDLQTLFEKIAPSTDKTNMTPKQAPTRPILSARPALAQSIKDRQRPTMGDSYQVGAGQDLAQQTYMPEEEEFLNFAGNWVRQTGAGAMLSNLAETPFGKAMTGNWTMQTGKVGAVLNAGKNTLTRMLNAVGNDNMQLMKSKSPGAQWFALNILESPSSYGRGVVSATAAAYDAMMHRVIGSTMVNWNSVVNEWAKTNGKSLRVMGKDTGTGISREGARGLYREVMLNMNDIRMGRAPRSGQDPHIAQLIEMLQKHGEASLDWLKGDDPNFSVLGMENVEYDPGYIPQRANGDAIYEAIKNGVIDKQGAVDAYSQGYQRAGLPVDIADKIAGANVSRALNRAMDVDTSLIDMLTEDGRTFLHERLLNEGIDPVEVDNIMQHLTGLAEERGKAGFAKHRNDLDMDTQVHTLDGSDMRLVDFMDYDLPNMLARYRKGVAGAGALARKGIRSRKERDVLFSAIQKEMRDMGEEPPVTDHLKAMLSDFDAGPSQGYAWGSSNKGIDPHISIAKKIANLSLLTNLGMSQLIDHANTMAVDGMGSWIAHTRAMSGLDSTLRNVNNGVLDDLTFLIGDVGMDHHIFREHMSIDEVGPQEGSQFMNTLRNVTNNLTYVQHFTSLFNTVRGHQQKIAAMVVTNKVLKAIKNGTDKARLQFDLGISPALHDYIKNLIDTGVIEFRDVNGKEYVNRLNPEQWSASASMDFGAIMTRAQDTLVMRNLPGETDAWMRTNVGSVLTHLKMFPLTSITKQMARNGRFMDSTTMGTTLFGMALSYLTLKVQDELYGRNVDQKSQLMRAIGYSNMTGWIPMAFDPTMTMLGLDEYRMQRYGRYYETQIPSLEVANKLLRSPGAAFKALGGEHLNADDRQALLAIPFAKTMGIGQWIVGH